MYLALYRAYRPEIFEEILGQAHIVKILKNQIKAGQANHAYLFCGTRGTGKTTMARILAKGMNCEFQGERPCGECENCKAIKDGIFMDVIEIDAASNNGVDNIRELRESVKYPPAVGTKKVYIIDEVHMLSSGAFNALLKTLEEPPEHVIFILATTDPQKLPATILSRCMRLDFKRISENLLVEGMEKICKEKGVEISDAALRLIAVNADGSVRDGLSILDQCLATGELKVTREDVLELIGAASEEVFIEIAEMIKNRDVGGAFIALDKALSDGKDARQCLKDLLAHYRNLLIVKYIKNPEDILNISTENAERIREQSEGIPTSDINRAIMEISKTASEAKWSTNPRVLLELCIAVLADEQGMVQVQKIESKKEDVNIATKPKSESVLKNNTDKEQSKENGSAEIEVETEIKTNIEANIGGSEETNIVSNNIDTDIATESNSNPKTESQNSDNLWDSLFEGDDALKGSISMIKNGANIETILENEYVISANSEFVGDIIDKNRGTIEALLEKKTGVFRNIKCVVKGKSPSDINSNKATRDFVAEASNVLGLDIEIED